METAMDILTKMQERLCRSMEQSCDIDYTKIMQARCDSYNAEVGDMPGSNCDKCRNKGLIAVIVDGREGMCECDCMVVRRSLQRIERSGLRDMVNNYTFDNYIASEGWQRQVKDAALRYCENINGAWFVLLGQPGAGKTHLCVAVAGSLMNAGKSALYSLWREDSVMLKALVNDEPAYKDKMDELKQVEVLYIDDFFKTERGKSPSAADINLAFELLNYRYNNSGLTTIISSEKSIDELLDIDEAIGSRIYQRAGQYCFAIGNDRAKNYRLNNKLHLVANGA